MKPGDLVMLKTSETLPPKDVPVFRVTAIRYLGWVFCETYFEIDGRRVAGKDVSFRVIQIIPFVPATHKP